jgi:hypothetical protein
MTTQSSAQSASFRRSATTGFPSESPFGGVCCEQEVDFLGRERYPDYFFEDTPFNAPAMDNATYLIIGRRGSGKTSLANYFEFQTHRPFETIDVDEPEIYEDVLSRVANLDLENHDRAVSRTVKVWECVVWHLVFERLGIKTKAMKICDASNGWAMVVKDVLRGLLEKFAGNREGTVVDRVEELLRSREFTAARERALEGLVHRPIVVAIDTLERYNVGDPAMMAATGALVEAASHLNHNAERSGLHVKVLLSGEIFPYLRDSVVRNTLKHIRDPLFLQWRPRDLLRLISWRLSMFLSHVKDPRARQIESVDWMNWRSVEKNVWHPFFGSTIRNGSGLKERTVPYLLRHTQMRPRQLVVLCNAIAKSGVRSRALPSSSQLTSLPLTFPIMADEAKTVRAVKDTEVGLASEVLNSYATVYPNVEKIVTALNGMPMVFRGNELDKVAPRTRRYWERGHYDPSEFKQIVAELGIVGVVRRRERNGPHLEADFEYNKRDRLVIGEKDECVLHPMFFEKLHTQIQPGLIVHPFPDHPDFDEMKT